VNASPTRSLRQTPRPPCRALPRLLKLARAFHTATPSWSCTSVRATALTSTDGDCRPGGPLTAQEHPRRIFATAIERGNIVMAEATAREPSRKKTGACGVVRARAGGRLAALRLAKLPAGSSDVQLDVVPSLARPYPRRPRYLRLLMSPARKMQDRGGPSRPGDPPPMLKPLLRVQTRAAPKTCAGSSAAPGHGASSRR
jgi:hypothetical protein